MSHDPEDVVVAYLPTRFTELGSRKPKLSRAQALRRAARAVEKLRDEFAGWVERDLSALRELVGGARQAGALDGGRYRRSYDHALAIRDVGASFGRQDITDVADSFCEMLFRMGETGRYDAGALDAHFDALRMVCAAPAMEPVELDVILADLARLVDRFPDPDAALRAEAAGKGSVGGS